MKTMQKGFTLIELMIVIAIIGILAAVAIPQYQNYIARTEVQTSIADVRGAMLAFEDYANRFGTLPTAISDVQDYTGVSLAPASSQPTKWDIGTISVSAANGAKIPVTFTPESGTYSGSAALSGLMYTLIGTVSTVSSNAMAGNESIAWAVSASGTETTLGAQYQPKF
tara:strand:- start:99 stop:602 length:504 start_codon:yes stop_codon:yes gene_type:complete